MVNKFPIYKAGQVFNEFTGEIKKSIRLKYNKISISYPIRLDAMAINPAAVCYNEDLLFTPGEVVVSASKFIKVNIKVINGQNELEIGCNTRRKVLVKHSYYLMKKIIGFNESLYIDVEDSDIPKHCGFGSSSSTIAAVAVAINEMYSHPIDDRDLIKYLAGNHGEEICDENENELKLVQCIGGGATGGLTNAGILIIAGRTTTIAKMQYEGQILIAIPNDFVEQDADVLMKKEEDNLWKFKKTGEMYSKEIAYEILHKALPDMMNNNLKGLADVVFNYRFNMGSIENCSFVYDNMVEQAQNLRKLYENNRCEFLALSSVGPAFFAIVNDESDKKYCIDVMRKNNMKIIETSVFNKKYVIDDFVKCEDVFWEKKETAIEFTQKDVSKYITDVIDEVLNEFIDLKDIKAIDIGCGGGRYSKYLSTKNVQVTALDKYPNMFSFVENENAKFIKATFDNIPTNSNYYDLALSIGVLHNSTTLQELKNGLTEMFRVLKRNSYAILSIFTDDIVTDDLSNKGNYVYDIINRPSMILLPKDKVVEFCEENGFIFVKHIDSHITDVGNGGKRYVYSILLQKK